MEVGRVVTGESSHLRVEVSPVVSHEAVASIHDAGGRPLGQRLERHQGGVRGSLHPGCKFL